MAIPSRSKAALIRRRNSFSTRLRCRGSTFTWRRRTSSDSPKRMIPSVSAGPSAARGDSSTQRRPTASRRARARSTSVSYATPTSTTARAPGELADLGPPEPHRFDLSGVRPDLDHVSDGNEPFEEEEEAGDDILDQALGPEADRQAHHPRRDQEGLDVHPELVEHDDQCHEGDEVAGEALQEGPHREGPLGLGGVVVGPRQGAEETGDEQRQEAGGQRAHE